MRTRIHLLILPLRLDTLVRLKRLPCIHDMTDLPRRALVVKRPLIDFVRDIHTAQLRRLLAR